MSTVKEPFVLEGQLLHLWTTAQDEFLQSFAAEDRELNERAEVMSNPGKWLKTFRKERRDKSNKFYHACNKIGPHLQTIQKFVQVVGFSVGAASPAAPAVSPAALIVNAFAWLFDSFANVSEDFDKIEEVFRLIASHLESLSSIDDYISHQDKSYILEERIVEMFICCLRICRTASEQIRDRFRKWRKRVSGTDELNAVMKEFAEADDALRFCLGIKTMETTLETKQNIQQIANVMSILLQTNSQDEWDEILEWLSTLESPKMHASIKQQAQGGSWLLESELFRAWREQDVNKVWYTGNPGAGKSVLASIIIDHLKSWAQCRSSQGNETAVAYLYLSYTPQPDMANLLGSILRQFQTNSDPDPEVLRKYREYRQGGKYSNKVQKPSLEDVKSLLSKVSANKTVFVVVDALDEFDVQKRGPLLKHIKEIKPDVKILVTSRVLEYLKKLQEGFQIGTIEAHDEDIDVYIEREIRSHPNLESFPTLHDQIKTQVKRKSGRMFIIVRLHMEALGEVQVKADLEEALEKLPDSIDGAYKATLERIKRGPVKSKDLALSTLGWVIHAQRPLSMRELQHALEIEKSPHRVGEEYSLQESEIISACCGLLVQDIDDTVRCVHTSASDFFARVKKIDFFNFDKQITLACARYLSIPSLQLHSATNNWGGSHLESSMEGNFALARYAGEYLHIHHRQVQNLQDRDVLEAIQTLVSDDSIRTLYSQLLFTFDAYDRNTIVLDDGKRRRIPRMCLENSLQPLHIAVYLGNPELVKNLIDEKADVNKLDPYGQSALTIAIKSGLDAIAGILLNYGAKADLSTRKGHVILLYAMENSYTKVVEQIIGNLTNKPLDEELRIIGILVLIMFATLEALKSFVTEFLLRIRTPTSQATDSPPLQPRTTGTPASDSSLEVYRMLLQSAYAGDFDSLQMLLKPSIYEPIDLSLVRSGDEGADGDSSGDSSDDDTDDYEPYDLRTIKMAFLVSAGFLASENKRYEVVDLLLEHGISPNLRNFRGQSLLHRATARCDYKMVKILINHGADRGKMLNLLVRHGASLDLRQREGCHELYEAAVFGATEAVKFFLDCGVDPSITNNFGWTPLHGAAANGHLDCVVLLLNKKANPSPVSDTGETPLDFVDRGLNHYDRLLTGETHYKAQITKSKQLQLTQPRKEYYRDEITNLLIQKGALTSSDLAKDIGEQEFSRRQHEHPGWGDGGWWEENHRHPSWYPHTS
ncbi:hypothetical protein F5Y13DRAFT_198994 [Hypoxylon sp. FL1857]|nr:hypothetical protein F5Y13DRAFT_198994 [Hypoxylon sp. FL1857]